MTTDALKKLDRITELLEQLVATDRPAPARSKAASSDPPPQRASAAAPIDEDELFGRIRARLLKDPAVLQVLVTKPEIEVSVTVEKIEVDGKSLRGRLALLITKGFFDTGTTGNAAFNELTRLGFHTAKPTVYNECTKLAELGFLTREQGGGYKAVADMKINVVRA